MSDHRIYRKSDEPQPTAFNLPRDPERAAACIIENFSVRDTVRIIDLLLQALPPLKVDEQVLKDLLDIAQQ